MLTLTCNKEITLKTENFLINQFDCIADKELGAQMSLICWPHCASVSTRVCGYLVCPLEENGYFLHTTDDGAETESWCRGNDLI